MSRSEELDPVQQEQEEEIARQEAEERRVKEAEEEAKQEVKEEAKEEKQEGATPEEKAASAQEEQEQKEQEAAKAQAAKEEAEREAWEKEREERPELDVNMKEYFESDDTIDFKRNHIIPEPFNLPWEYVAPAPDGDGFMLWVNADTALHIARVHNMDRAFDIKAQLLSMRGFKLEDENVHAVFMHEVAPLLPTPAKIERKLDGTEGGLFFTKQEMETMNLLFEQNNFVSSQVTIYYDNRPVNEFTALDKKSFQEALDVIEQIGVQATLDPRMNREQLNRKYEESLREQAKNEKFERNRSKLSEEEKELRNEKLGKAALAMVGAAALIGGGKILFQGKRWYWKAAGVVAMAGGIFAEAIIKHQVTSIMERFTMKQKRTQDAAFFQRAAHRGV